MWDKILKYLPSLLINAVGPVTELIQQKNKEKLKDIKVYCDQVEARMLTPEQAIELIKSVVKD
jgi:hypothetical protein